MDEDARGFRERMQQAVKEGGPDAVLEALAGLGFAIEKAPEPGVELRMRVGAGTDEGLSTTLYSAAARRPAGWPDAVPFLPGVAGSLTLFDRPGRGFSAHWFRVPDPPAAAERILAECRAAGWRRAEEAGSSPPPGPAGTRSVVLERDDARRTLVSVVIGEGGMLQLMERRAGESCAVGPPPPGAPDDPAG